MYERMLDKENQPDYETFAAHCGKAEQLFIEFDKFLIEDLKTEKLMRFPYGNHYGWGYKYRVKKKHICDVFAEREAFTVMIRLTNKQFKSIYKEMLPYTKDYIDHKYPCVDGGWIHYRVLTEAHLQDVKRIVEAKMGMNVDEAKDEISEE